MDQPLVSVKEQEQAAMKEKISSNQIGLYPLTRTISDPEEIISTIYSVSRRASSDTIDSFYFGTMDRRAPEIALYPEFFTILQSIRKENPDEKFRFIIDIQKENLQSVKKLIDAGYEA